jgi:hypothetical protein
MAKSSSRILTRSLASLRLSVRVRNGLLTAFFRRVERSGEIPEANRERTHWCDEQSKHVTVGQLIAAYGNMPDLDTDKKVIRDPVPLRRFKAKLIELGLTATDWPRLAASTKEAAEVQLSSVRGGTQHIRFMSVALLPMSGLALKMLEYYFQCDRGTIRVVDLLTTSQDSWCARGYDSVKPLRDGPFRAVGRRSDVSRSIQASRRKLRQLGFSWRDGIFLDEYSERWHVERIKRDLKVSTNRAAEIFRYARRQNWRIEQ